jgi:L-threonylcarbamoyladenylate synthase
MPETILTQSVEEAAAIIRRSGLVAFPTETVYGLGGNALDEAAVARVFEAKGRPSDNPLIVHLASISEIGRVAETLPPVGKALADAFMPGPLTLVVPRRADVSDLVTAGLDTVAVRVPDEPIARQLIELSGVPLVAPSANRSGRPSPTTWEAVRDDLYGRIDAILRGEATRIGLESTVVDVTGDVPLILRAGGLSIEDIRRVAPDAEFYSPAIGETIRSPGLLYRHYSPRARVVLVDSANEAAGGDTAAFIGLAEPTGTFALTQVCASPEQYAQTVFAFFRRCDEANLEMICAQRVEEAGIGRALMDRLRRAAEGTTRFNKD